MWHQYAPHFFSSMYFMPILSSVFCCFLATCLLWPFNYIFHAATKCLFVCLFVCLFWHQILLQGIHIWHFHLQPFPLHGFSFKLIMLLIIFLCAVSCNRLLSSWSSGQYVFPDNSEPWEVLSLNHFQH